MVCKLPYDQGVFYGAVIGTVTKKKNGRGVYHLSNRDFYEGSWLDDRPQEGAYVDHENDRLFFTKYKSSSSDASQGGGGALADNPFCGALEGHIDFGNSKMYTGSIENFLPHGRGICRYADGSRYNGMWSRGKYHGYGQFTDRSGARSCGNWKNGKLDCTRFDLSFDNAGLDGKASSDILASLTGMQPQPHARDRVSMFTAFMQAMRPPQYCFSACLQRASMPITGLCFRSFPL